MRIASVLFYLWAINLVAEGFPVIDPMNLIENGLQVLKQIDQIEQTAARIKFQVNSALRFAKKLNNYEFSSVGDLLRDIRSFQYRARSIGYTYKSIVSQFEKTYGKKGDFSKNYSAWEKQSDDSIKDAMEAQGLIEHSDKQMQDLNQAIIAKSKAETEEETLQAIGEVNAIQTKQLNDMKQIIATDARARNSVIMEQRAKEREQKRYEANLMKDFNVHKKSRPLA
jgi:P-type conjugative transfer protein TrbJ